MSMQSKPGPTDAEIICLANLALPGWTRKDNDLAYIEVVRAAIRHIEEQRTELLAALLALRDGGPVGAQDFRGWHSSYEKAIALARAAIAKATGAAA